ncbi:MAG: DNA polymerase Y family protein [Polyangiaceae bacterium]
MTERRIAAVVMPELLLELALRRGEALREAPFAVVWSAEPGEEATAARPLEAVSVQAASFGVQVGQSIAEARVLAAALRIVELSRQHVEKELGHLAEALLGFGMTAALAMPDTVWVDVSGSAHLVGGEQALARELADAMQELGHRARVALAPGPILAQAFARWSTSVAQGQRDLCVIAASDVAARAQELPIVALPVSMDLRTWLVQLGVLTFGQLMELPRAEVAARLGEAATSVLALAQGIDDAPLEAHRPAVVPSESMEWDEAVSGLEPLKFVLRGLTSRLSARLNGRGEAAQHLQLTLNHDRSLARLSGAPPHHILELQLATPLWRAEELLRVLSTRLERVTLQAPTVGVTLSAPGVVRALGRQLDLARVVSKTTGTELLPALVAELSQDIGPSRIGTLTLLDAHRPEARARLKPAFRKRAPAPSKRRQKKSAQIPLVSIKSVDGRNRQPTRLLPTPVPLAVPFRRGVTLGFDQRLYTIESVRFAERLESVEWWTGRAVARDYVWLTLKGADGVLEALAYVDRVSGKRYLQGLFD